jgi:hypothetical protein
LEVPISYNGVPTPDGAFAATTIEANVGIYTAKNVNPMYIKWGESLIGTGPAGCPPVTVAECQFRMKVIGFATDPSRIGTANNKLNFYYVDVNPGTGAKTVRSIIPAAVLANQAVTPLVKDQGFFGRFRIDIVKKQTNTTIPPVTGGPTLSGGLSREILVSIDDGGVMADGSLVPDTSNLRRPVTPNGLVAGQYWAPMPEYLFPETATPGLPPPPANFQCLGHVQNGWSLNFGAGPVTIPRLTPFPGTSAAGPINCSTNP